MTNPPDRLARFRADVAAVFDPETFSFPRLPVHAGRINPGLMAPVLPSCLDMLVMLPGGDVTLPDPYRTDGAASEFVRQGLGRPVSDSGWEGAERFGQPPLRLR